MNKKEIKNIADGLIMTLKNMNEEQIKEFVRELILDNGINTNKFITTINDWTQ